MRRLGLLLLLGSIPLAADEVFLKNGSSIKGVVTKDDGRIVTIRIGQGTIDLERHLVERIVRDDSSPVSELDQKIADAAAKNTARAYWELADWCSQRGVTTSLRGILARARSLENPKLTRVDLMKHLLGSGIRQSSIRSWIEMGEFSDKLDDKEFASLREIGAGQDLADWIVRRHPAPYVEPEPAKAVAPQPPAPSPQAKPRPTPLVEQKYGFHGPPGMYILNPLVVNGNTWFPQSFGPTIFYSPYDWHPVYIYPSCNR